MKFVRNAALSLFSALLVACGGGGGGGGNAPLAPLVFQPFATASVVIGQPDMVSSGANTGGISDKSLAAPGFTAFVGGTYFVADVSNNRILAFATIPATNHPSASFVLGQPDFVTSTFGTSATTLNQPVGLAASGGRLYCVEFNNNRCGVFNPVPAATATPLSFALGQPDLVTRAPDTTQTALRSPLGVFALGSLVLVADELNSRVLIWTSPPAGNADPADLVLGQADFVSGDANRGGAVAANTMGAPSDVWTDGTRVIVADRANHRVLIWVSFPTVNGQAADLVLGQPGFTTVTAASGSTGLSSPSSVSVRGEQLFVGDPGNSRVLAWSTIPTANQAPADQVIGQSNFANTTGNDDDQNGVPDATPSARTFDQAAFLFVRAIANQLHVSDFGNDRVLIFEP